MNNMKSHCANDKGRPDFGKELQLDNIIGLLAMLGAFY